MHTRERRLHILDEHTLTDKQILGQVGGLQATMYIIVQTCRQMQTDRQTGTQAGRQAGRCACMQAGRQIQKDRLIRRD